MSEQFLSDTLSDDGLTFNMVALKYKRCGLPGLAAQMQRNANAIASETERADNLGRGLGELSGTLRLLGALRESEYAARRASAISRELKDRAGEAVSLHWFGLALAARGTANESGSALRRALRIYTTLSESEGKSEGKSLGYSFLAQGMSWLGGLKPRYRLPTSRGNSLMFGISRKISSARRGCKARRHRG